MIFNVRVYGLHESMVASGYPKRTFIKDWGDEEMHVTEHDEKRALKLARAKAASGHDCYLKGVVVQADFNMSQGWWLQSGRYTWFSIVSSQSKEHNCRELFGVDDPDEVKLGDKLTARVSTNYLQLKTMYAQRRHHRRAEWQEFCDWVVTLPDSEMITMGVL